MRFPDKFKLLMPSHVVMFTKPFEILREKGVLGEKKSLNVNFATFFFFLLSIEVITSCCVNDFLYAKACYLLSESSNLRKLRNFGKFLSETSPTFMRLRLSKAENASVSPSIFVLRQLSKFNSLICG